MSETAAREAKPATICCNCRRHIYRQRNGAWYHTANGSVSCRPGEGSGRTASPAEVPAAVTPKGN
jgi:hypothetical protein